MQDQERNQLLEVLLPGRRSRRNQDKMKTGKEGQAGRKFKGGMHYKQVHSLCDDSRPGDWVWLISH